MKKAIESVFRSWNAKPVLHSHRKTKQLMKILGKRDDVMFHQSASADEVVMLKAEYFLKRQTR